MDEEADAGDHQQHDHGELIHLQVEASCERARRNPIEEMLVNEGLPAGKKFTHGFERKCER